MTRDHRPLTLLFLCAFLALALWSARAVPGAEAQAGCAELITRGGFESDGGWLLGRSPVPPLYATDQKHSGNRALRLGIVAGTNVQSYSSARQAVTIPAGAQSVRLSFWFYAVYTGAPETDYMELVLLAPDGYTVLDKVWHAANDSRSWNQLTFDVTRWHGNTVQVYFNVYNDGAGGVAGMYLDDVSLLACDLPGDTATPTGTRTVTVTPTPTGSRTATPTPTGTTLSTHTPTATPIYIVVTPSATATPVYVIVTPTATATPYYVLVTPTATPYYVIVTPTGSATPYYVLVTPTSTGTAYYVPPYPPPDCVDLIRNGSFEQGLAGWTPGLDPVPAQVVGSPVHSGARSLMLGQNAGNVLSYSSARQLVTIPATSGQVLLQFWTWTWADGGGSDHQEADFLAPNLGVVQKLWRPLANERAWVFRQIPVTQYAGETVWVYFNAYNDGVGGSSGMYLDDVNLLACGAYAVQPYVQVEQPAPVMMLVTSTATPGPLILLVTPTSSPTSGAVVSPTIGVAPAVALAETLTPTPGTTVIALPTREPEIVVAVEPTATPVPGFAQALANFIQDIWPRPWWLPFAVILGLIVVVILLRWLLPYVLGPPP